MNFERTRVCGFENALYGMRNPKNSWNKIDSKFGLCSKDEVTEEMVILRKNNSIVEYAIIGENDMKLAQSLIKAGSEHRKFLRQIQVEVTITAPLYWWKEFSTYKVGTVANSTSTMHKLASTPITMDCFECPELIWGIVIESLEETRQEYLKTKDKKLWKRLIVNLPESWLQTRTVTMNYENVLSMYKQRCIYPHKLNEWSGRDNSNVPNFKSWVESLPYAKELICIKEEM